MLSGNITRFLDLALKYINSKILLLTMAFWDYYKVPGSSITKVVTIVTFAYMVTNLKYKDSELLLVTIASWFLDLALQKLLLSSHLII